MLAGRALAPQVSLAGLARPSPSALAKDPNAGPVSVMESPSHECKIKGKTNTARWAERMS